MSEVQETTACIHNSSKKKLTQVEHDKAGLLPLVMLCPDCISFYQSAYCFKIIRDNSDNIETTENKISNISENYISKEDNS